MNHRCPKFLREEIDTSRSSMRMRPPSLRYRPTRILFSGAVFAHQSVNAAGFESQIDAAKHADPIKLATKIEVAT
jgi:hypothetical protein